MMKKLFLLAFAGIAATAVSAQDIIVRRNASTDEIEARIVEIGPDRIRYRLYSMPDGPIRVIDKSEVFFIRYEDGTKEVINDFDAQPAAPAAAAAAVAKIERKPMRDKSLEFQLTPSVGAGMLLFDGDAWAGGVFAMQAGIDYYFSAYSTSCLGAALGYSYAMLDEADFQTFGLDLYWGSLGPGAKSSAFSCKTGLALEFPLSCKYDGYDLSEALSGFGLGLFVQGGWSWRHADLGLRLQYTPTNRFKGIESTYFGITACFSYRF